MNQESVHKLLIGLLIATLFVISFNSVRLSTMKSFAPAVIAAPDSLSARASTSTIATNADGGDSLGIIPKGIPAIYGQELGVSFDDVSADNPQKADATIRKLGQLDQTITLFDADKERYINIGYKLDNGIACEYCCGARSIIFPTGEAACGCAHSFAMRGLAKYLITKHGKEYTDEQILEEMGKWKVLFFPGIHEQKAQVLKSKGIELNYINLASNKYRGIEKNAAAGDAGGGMVGGC